MVIVSANVPAGTVVSAITGTTVTLSANATATASGTVARFSAVSDAQAIGGTGGAQNHTLTAAESGVLTYTTMIPSSASVISSDGGLSSSPDTGSRLRAVSQGITIFTTSNAGDLPHSNIPPTIVLPFIFRVI
jgi:microcystin-dependent protein